MEMLAVLLAKAKCPSSTCSHYSVHSVEHCVFFFVSMNPCGGTLLTTATDGYMSPQEL